MATSLKQLLALSASRYAFCSAYLNAVAAPGSVASSATLIAASFAASRCFFLSAIITGSLSLGSKRLEERLKRKEKYQRKA